MKQPSVLFVTESQSPPIYSADGEATRRAWDVVTERTWRGEREGAHPRVSSYPTGFAVGVRRARKTVRWTVFTDERAGRPWKGFSVRKTGPYGFSAREPPQEATGKAAGDRWDGVRHARKMIQWIIFSAERAGRPWLSVPVPGSRRMREPPAKEN